MPPRHPLPSFKDWALLSIGAVFAILGLAILFKDTDVGIVTFALFGSCTVMFAHNILRKYRFRRYENMAVTVPAGVPILTKPHVPITLGAWLMVLGIVLTVFGGNYPAYFRWATVVMAMAGAGFLAAIYLGFVQLMALQFDPEGLRITQGRWRVLAPWDRITGVGQMEMFGNPTLLLAIHDSASLTVEPPEQRAKAISSMTRTEKNYGATFFIMTDNLGVDLPVLAAAIQTYCDDASARAGLTRQLAKPSA